MKAFLKFVNGSATTGVDTAFVLIPDTIRNEILHRIERAEQEHGVSVLLAVESGSRAWGFASADSDYDVRFVYIHPRDWYLSIGSIDERDVIEYPIVDEIDINGWDVRKASRLLRNSNPTIVEWVHSPIVYVERGSFVSRVRRALPEVYSPARGIHHYRSMATREGRKWLESELGSSKKCCYVLRALLSVQWLERHGEPAPIEFEKLLREVDDRALVDDIRELLAIKRAAAESDVAPHSATIRAFIERELERLESLAPAPEVGNEVAAELDGIFRACLAGE